MKLQKVQKLLTGEYRELYGGHGVWWVSVRWEEGRLISEWWADGLPAVSRPVTKAEGADDVERIIRSVCADFRKVRGLAW